ncbi:MAG: MotA/TolQ/ExbB proton channel family protein [Lentisphaerae bacterium]|nr:MotA/TolQ/ExbB proton channel family protein [Lentisphaerota bacterium]
MRIVWSLFEHGGFVMWPLLLTSLVSVAITIERAIFWCRAVRNENKEKLSRALDILTTGDIGQALGILRDQNDISARVVRSGLEEKDHGFSETMEIQASSEIGEMKKGLGVLDTIVTMAPLLGILGTVLGIIESFNLLGDRGIHDPKAVTAGIAQALITTAAGLTIALMTLIPLNYFMARTDKAAKAIERICTRFEIAFKKCVKQ